MRIRKNPESLHKLVYGINGRIIEDTAVNIIIDTAVGVESGKENISFLSTASERLPVTILIKILPRTKLLITTTGSMLILFML